MIVSANEKGIDGNIITLTDGTEIDSDEILKYFSNEILIITSVNSYVSSPSTSSAITEELPCSELARNWATDYIINWTKIPDNILQKLNNSIDITRTELNVIIRIIADDVYCISPYPDRRYLKIIANKICLKYPNTFLDTYPDGEIIGEGNTTILKKLEERINYIKTYNNVF